MAIDASIISRGVQPVQMPDPMNRLAQVMQIQSAQNQNSLAQYGLAKAQRQDQESGALAELMRSGVDLNTPEGQAKAYGAAPLSAAGLIKQQLENQNIQSQIGERQATAKSKAFDQAKEGYNLFQQAVGSHITNPNSTPQDAVSSVAGLVQAGVMDPKAAQGLLSNMPADPQGFRMYLHQVVSARMTPEQMLTVFSPKAEKVDTGGSVQMVDTNPNSPTFGKPVMASMPKTVTPDAQLSASTSRANNQATIAAENLRAGVTPDGAPTPDIEATAQAIAKGQLMPPSGAALINPKNARVLARVVEINPDYDATTVLAKKKAANDFTTGSQGNSMRSFAVAGQHLDQLGQLVDALDNGNMQLVNKIGNIYSQQTGSPAVTNFEAAKDVVSKEVVKAIVAGPGGVDERKRLDELMADAKSPAQLKGVIRQYRNLMAAQHDALLQQRRAAGLPDSTLPNYTDANGTGNTAPGGWSIIGVSK